jgi:hypothetical protein
LKTWDLMIFKYQTRYPLCGPYQASSHLASFILYSTGRGLAFLMFYSPFFLLVISGTSHHPPLVFIPKNCAFLPAIGSLKDWLLRFRVLHLLSVIAFKPEILVKICYVQINRAGFQQTRASLMAYSKLTSIDFGKILHITHI